MKLNRKTKKKVLLRKRTALYEQALDLYFNDYNIDEALNILFGLADSGFKKAYGQIGNILYMERIDVQTAEKWFVKAEEHGALSSSAAYQYGMLIYLEKRDWEKGLRYLLSAAEQGYELAYGDIGIILYMEKYDYSSAEKWFAKAEENDVLLAPAAYYYGFILQTERNEQEKCKKYFIKAAEEDFEPAYGEYASLLYMDQKDIDKAELYFNKAEEANTLYAPHAYTFGELLINERNEFERGKKYIELAEADGY